MGKGYVKHGLSDIYGNIAMSNDLKEPTQKNISLHWLTRWITIVAFLSSIAFVYIGAIFGPTPYEYDHKWFWVIAIIAPPFILFIPLYSAWIPFLIIRQWRYISGIYLVLLSLFFISVISYSWVKYKDTNYWDRYDSWIIYFLPPWILTCTSGLLRILSWWKERKQHRI